LPVASKRPPVPSPIFILSLTSWINPVALGIMKITMGPPKRLAAPFGGSLMGVSPLWPVGRRRRRWTELDYPKVNEFHETVVTALNIQTFMMTMMVIIYNNSST
jgi:hypothetical protein